MAKITQQELRKLAQLGSIQLEEHEMAHLSGHIESVLSYAERVNEIAQGTDLSLNKWVNVFREDIVRETESAILMAQAPSVEENYFVVPMVIDK